MPINWGRAEHGIQRNAFFLGPLEGWGANEQRLMKHDARAALAFYEGLEKNMMWLHYVLLWS